MSFGWVDFSDDGSVSDYFKDKKPVEPRDPLKISAITRYFAGRFYPEIKTQLTRAKYYVAVPYALLELEEKVKDHPEKYASEKEIKELLVEIEKRQRDWLCKNSPDESFPGCQNKGKSFNYPSEDYWSSLKSLGILDPKVKDYSLNDCLKNLPKIINTTEKRWDDLVSDLYEQYKQNGPDKLKITLTEEEKQYVSGRFKEKSADSPFAKILEKAKASEKDRKEITEKLKSDKKDKFLIVKDIYSEIGGNDSYIIDFRVATVFSEFVYVLKIIYEERILKSKADAKKRWENLKLDRLIYLAKNLDLDVVKLSDDKIDDAKQFLSKAKELVINNKADKDKIFDKLDKLICNRLSIDIKHNISDSDKWKGQEKPDFYSGTAVRILLDLIDG